MSNRETDYGKGDEERFSFSEDAKKRIEKIYGQWKPKTAEELKKNGGKFKKVYK